ncbi:hypothetical protein Ait01nite_031340 [Actinoplanes italicus]|uniref:PPE family protein n=1 Tax=Actinoplanes italicus TaxID=113567 RepID=A0A2T0KJ79_9ACTN|nr:hypothetical protein [Actinoplanes italicus]PRX23590.1 hypothetical protein CLV67_103339 [Actinoplanes italicus]GIE30089.1 hypothetical protein Ait01nite_031340 [Actinoplanes italicus]
MADHYGASANPNYGYSQYSGQTHYGSYPPSTLPYTAPPGPGNQTTIEQISHRISNMHPEEMAALADQWQNAWAFLADVRGFLIRQSDVLRDESWQSPAARDAFLRRGPGETLTYLDVWMDAAQQNVTALRHLVNVSNEARYAMARLEVNYARELKDSANLDFAEHLGVWLSEGQGWDAAAEEHISEQQTQIRQRYQLEAQRLAQHYGDQFFDYIAVLSNGVGPPVQPLNAVLNQPPALPPGTGGPGGIGGPGQFAPPIPVLPVGNNPPAAELPGVIPPGQNQPPGLLPPGVQLPAPVQPGVVPPGSLPPGVTPPGTLPPGVALPQPGGVAPPAVFPPGTLPPGALPGQPLPVPGTGVPGTGGPVVIPPGTVRPGIPPQVNRPGGPIVAVPPNLPGRTIRRPAAPVTPVVPPGGREIRRTGPVVVPPQTGRPGAQQRPTRTTPGAAPQPQTERPGRGTPGIFVPPPANGRPGVTPPPATGRPGVTPPPATGRPGERRRSQPGTPPAPPQTQNGRPGRDAPGVTPPPPATGRPGDRRSARPGGTTPVPQTPGRSDTFGRPPVSAAPPVLKNPVEDRGARPGSAAEVRTPSATQRPGGTAPPVLNRPVSPAAPPPYRPPRREPGAAAWSDLFGAEEARRRGGNGVIDAPERARPDGGPWGLRSRAATRPEGYAEPNKPGTVAPELGKRRGGGEPIPVRQTDDPITDDQAFGVRTPGGGVVAGRGDDRPEEDIGRALRGR